MVSRFLVRQSKILLPGRSSWDYWNKQEFCIFGCAVKLHNRAEGRPVLPRCLSEDRNILLAIQTLKVCFVNGCHIRQDSFPQQDGSQQRKPSGSFGLQNCGGTPHENRCCCSCCSGGCCCGSKHARCLHCCSTSRHADLITPARTCRRYASGISRVCLIHAPRSRPISAMPREACSYCLTVSN